MSSGLASDPDLTSFVSKRARLQHWALRGWQDGLVHPGPWGVDFSSGALMGDAHPGSHGEGAFTLGFLQVRGKLSVMQVTAFRPSPENTWTLERQTRRSSPGPRMPWGCLAHPLLRLQTKQDKAGPAHPILSPPSAAIQALSSALAPESHPWVKTEART